MKVFCIPEFREEFNKIISKKKYKHIQDDLIKYLFNKQFHELQQGTRLNGSSTNPYIKKRIDGSGGSRLYYYLIINKENIYLMFLHPKTGSMGSSNIKDQDKARLYKEVLKCIKSNDLYLVELNKESTQIEFKKLETILT